MNFFDLHCDTISKIVCRKSDFLDDDALHVNLPGLISSHVAVQVFACFVPGNRPPEICFSECNSYIDAVEDLVRRHENKLAVARSDEEIARAMAEGKTAVILSIEGAAALKGEPEILDHFYGRGVRLLTLAWDDNVFCGSVFGEKTGLTRKGETLVRTCESLGVAIDVSHASDKAFYDIAKVTRKPFTASHSNARAVCPNDRNLTDDMIRLVAQRNGIVGLTFGSGFIDPDYYEHEKKNRVRILKGLKDGSLDLEEAGRISRRALSHLPAASLSLLVAHARHILNVGGEGSLAIGSDFDGVDSLAQGLSGAESLPTLVREMERQRIGSRVIEKICFQNARRYFSDILG